MRDPSVDLRDAGAGIFALTAPRSALRDLSVDLRDADMGFGLIFCVGDEVGLGAYLTGKLGNPTFFRGQPLGRVLLVLGPPFFP